ncbi:unnamed protein product [Blepharisma stoltei]|uniref:Uncharacterized protein n=1 Tax=Blepharisma stoltei TaxID=1481888 RepID=A0AAU9IEL1_9CILI|nr:unnamed protein product [Blepharisma stoltei]
MDIKRCSEPDCEFEAEYVCKYTSPWTYSCKQHTGKYIELPNKTLALEFISIDPYEGTKEAILGFLTKEKLENNKLKRNTLASFSQHLLKSENYIKELIKNLNSSSDLITNYCLKIEGAKTISMPMQDPILELLSLQPSEAVEKVKMMIPANSDWYESAKLFCGFSEKMGNMIESFIKDKFEVHIDKRPSKIEYMQEEHSKAITLTNSESESILTSSDTLFLFHRKNVKEPIKLKTENEASLLNSQISTVSNDLNSKPKEIESALNAIDTLRNKTAKILSESNNPELEIDFRATSSAIRTNSNLYDPPLKQAYQDYLNAYQQKTSLYNIIRDNNRTNLHIYNTETEAEEFKILQTPEPLDETTCITQLPNGKLFCFGNCWLYGITVLIDVNGGVEVLPSGTSCKFSSCIYFNNSVYCFGGYDEYYNALTLSSRFDFDRNQWIQLIPMPQADFGCNSIIFNGNILISGYENRNLWLYSIDIDSFSTIPYEFEDFKRKVLINAERLYLIECYGSIYESEIGSYSNWRRIRKSKIKCNPDQVCCLYNKGGICIGTDIGYFKFDFKKKKID